MIQIKKYKFAIRVYSIDMGLPENKRRRVDFLLDGERITRENTIFIGENDIRGDYRQKFSENMYDLIEIKKIPWTDIISLQSIKTLILSLLSLDKNFLLAAYEQGVWEYIIRNYHFDHLICYNDTSPAHRYRNRVLKQHRITTWYYNHSSDYAYLYEKGDGEKPYDLYDEDRVNYRGLEYDRMICWDKRQAEFFENLDCKIGEYIITGCLWSQFIRKKEKSEKIIGVFDTSVIPITRDNHGIRVKHLPNTEDDIIAFYEGIKQVMTSFPGYKFVIKTKNLKEDSKNLRDQYAKMKKEGVFHGLEGFDEKNQEATTQNLDTKREPSEVIEVADLIICAPFTSIGVEAREAGIPAIYFDASDKWRGTYLDSLGIVAHNPEELRRMITDFLAKGTTTNESHAIDIFRNALLRAR